MVVTVLSVHTFQVTDVKLDSLVNAILNREIRWRPGSFHLQRMIEHFLHIFKIDDNTGKISWPVGLEPTSLSFRGRCLNYLETTTVRYLSLYFRLSYLMLQCSDLREKSTKIMYMLLVLQSLSGWRRLNGWDIGRETYKMWVWVSPTAIFSRVFVYLKNCKEL